MLPLCCCKLNLGGLTGRECGREGQMQCRKSVGIFGSVASEELSAKAEHSRQTSIAAHLIVAVAVCKFCSTVDLFLIDTL